jgi:hypothetical protein
MRCREQSKTLRPIRAGQCAARFLDVDAENDPEKGHEGRPQR